MNKKAKYEIEVEGKKCTLSSLDRQTLEVALSLVMPGTSQPQYIRAGEIILRNCWIEGDKEILDDDNYLVAAAMQAFELIELKEAKLKKL